MPQLSCKLRACLRLRRPIFEVFGHVHVERAYRGSGPPRWWPAGSRMLSSMPSGSGLGGSLVTQVTFIDDDEMDFEDAKGRLPPFRGSQLARRDVR